MSPAIPPNMSPPKRPPIMALSVTAPTIALKINEDESYSGISSPYSSYSIILFLGYILYVFF